MGGCNGRQKWGSQGACPWEIKQSALFVDASGCQPGKELCGKMMLLLSDIGDFVARGSKLSFHRVALSNNVPKRIQYNLPTFFQKPVLFLASSFIRSQ